MRIRPATRAELPTLQDIERAAGAPFRALGMAAIADDEPPTLALLEEFRHAGRAWVATGEGEGEGESESESDGTPVAYLLSTPVDTATHIEQVTVHPRAARHRIGQALIEHTAERAREQGREALTLTTFADVPWNAPYYARIGFHVLAEAELTPGLRKIRAHEAELGLDRWPRVAMRRELTPGGTTPRTAP
ncbi:GNAT family N-acetyltransferase [Streptomyces durmitorensis]|uniref:GNAT family N-acetyltransferase n=1 Tax=Streptomyces durmitorensis TaxID=319947 RepID=A0ABY4PNQ6_9ACTN|nr:GNAT family N-acetyltransferase [Streptomyces durmitorensis]UQT55448.1 GNAT family N-acetyltransferase [Streptomyces durmitorensis]